MSWTKAQAKSIKKKLAQDYGSGWKYLSAEQQTNAYSSQILKLLLAQDMEKYEPAQSLVESLLAELAW